MSENLNRNRCKFTLHSDVTEQRSARGFSLSISALLVLVLAMPVAAQETAEETAQKVVTEIIREDADSVSGGASGETLPDIPDEAIDEEVEGAVPGAAEPSGEADNEVDNVEVSSPAESDPPLFGVDLSTYESPRDPIDTYLDAIESAEISNGAYSTDLADLYLGLGKVYLENREFEEAKESFQQGMQIMRVNFGLNSPEQTSYLFAVADIESIQGNRRAANEVISHVYTINAKNFGNKAPEMVPVLTQILNWYSKHRPADAPDNFYEDLERAGNITSEMAEIVELDKGLGHPDTTEMYRKQGQIHWHTAKYVLGRGISVEPGVIMATGKPSYSVHVKEVSIKEHFREGREAFTKVAASVALDENTSMIEKAEAIAQVGDWNLAFGKKQAAGKAFIQAYQFLAQESRSEQLADDYFRNPVPVRFMDDTLQSHESDVPADLYVTASLTVTEGGRALNIEMVDPPEQVPQGQLRMISREINGMHFRPALGDGVPVRTNNFNFQYPLTLSTEES